MINYFFIYLFINNYFTNLIMILSNHNNLLEMRTLEIVV